MANSLTKTADDFRAITICEWIRFHFSGNDFEHCQAYYNLAFGILDELFPQDPEQGLAMLDEDPERSLATWERIVAAVEAAGWIAPEDITQEQLDGQWGQLVARHFTPATLFPAVEALEQALDDVHPGTTLADWQKLCAVKREAMALMAGAMA